MVEPKRPAAAPAPQAHGGDLMKMFEGPGEETLAEGQRKLVESARNVFKELEKLLRAIGLYGHEHQGTQRFRGVFRQAVRGMFAQTQERIDLTVGPYEFTLYDQVVYQNANPEKNFVYKFFQDGVRRLRFDPDVTDKELDDLLDVMLTNWDDPTLFEDDSVTVMWSKEFEHITYKVIESFREDTAGPGEDDGYTVDAVVGRVKSAAPTDRIEVREAGARPSRPGQPMPSPGGGGGGGGLGGGRKADLTRSLITEADLGHFQEAPFAMDEHEFGVLRDIVAGASANTLEKFIEILFKVCLVPDAASRDRALSSLERIVELLLSADRYADLGRVMQRVRSLTGPSGELLFENLEVIDGIFDRWGTTAFVEAVIERLTHPHEVDAARLALLLKYLNPSAGIEIARQLHRVQVPERRAAILEFLPEMLAGNLKEVGRLLQSCEGTTAHEIMRALRTVEGLDILPAVQGALSNPDGTVRLEALGALPPDKLHVYLSHILNALKDKSKVVRGKAIHLLARMPSPQVHSHLVQRIRDRDFGDIDLDEKRRFFAAAALTGNPTPWFVELLDDRSLLQRKESEEMRACAAVGLALRMHAPAVPLFEREIARKFQTEVVRDSAQWALQHVRQTREERTRQLYDILFKGTLTYPAGHPQGGTA